MWPLVLEAVRGKGHFGEFWKAAVDGKLYLIVVVVVILFILCHHLLRVLVYFKS